MTSLIYDLHMHTNSSDGTDTVEELIDKASQVPLAGISITDHDTLNAYQKAPKIAEAKGIKLLPGIEISTTFEGESIHLLAYAFSLTDQKFSAFVSHLAEVRKERNLKILQKLKEHGMPLDISKLKEDIGVIGRPHMANALLKLGYVKTAREAFDRFIAEGRPCFVPGKRPEIKEAIEVVHQANAFAVVAHPHFIKKDSIARKILKLPLDGVEVYYAHLAKYQEDPWYRRAEKKGLYMTGGSDYHGKNKAHISLGASWTPESTFNVFWRRYLENSKL